MAFNDDFSYRLRWKRMHSLCKHNCEEGGAGYGIWEQHPERGLEKPPQGEQTFTGCFFSTGKSSIWSHRQSVPQTMLCTSTEGGSSERPLAASHISPASQSLRMKVGVQCQRGQFSHVHLPAIPQAGAERLCLFFLQSSVLVFSGDLFLLFFTCFGPLPAFLPLVLSFLLSICSWRGSTCHQPCPGLR